MPLDRCFRATLYVVVAVLFVTGAAWLVLNLMTGPFSPTPWQGISTYLLMVHGGVAMLFLLLLGAVIALHVPGGWRLRRNRPTGAIMLSSNAVLVGTAFGLYYFGSDALRRWTSSLHIALGLGFPLLLVIHLAAGKRSTRSARGNTQPPQPPSGSPLRHSRERNSVSRRSPGPEKPDESGPVVIASNIATVPVRSCAEPAADRRVVPAAVVENVTLLNESPNHRRHAVFARSVEPRHTPME